LKFWPAIAVLALLAGSATNAAAQGPGPVRWPRSVSGAADGPTSLIRAPLNNAAGTVGDSPRLRLAGDSAAIAPTHWKAGALIGGGFLGLLGAVTGVQLSCYDGPCHNRLLGAVGGFALAGIVGFGVGALIGGQFPAGTP
jgi:hypothetical protein